MHSLACACLLHRAILAFLLLLHRTHVASDCSRPCCIAKKGWPALPLKGSESNLQERYASGTYAVTALSVRTPPAGACAGRGALVAQEGLPGAAGWTCEPGSLSGVGERWAVQGSRA